MPTLPHPELEGEGGAGASSRSFPAEVKGVVWSPVCGPLVIYRLGMVQRALVKASQQRICSNCAAHMRELRREWLRLAGMERGGRR